MRLLLLPWMLLWIGCYVSNCFILSSYMSILRSTPTKEVHTPSHHCFHGTCTTLHDNNHGSIQRKQNLSTVLQRYTASSLNHHKDSDQDEIRKPLIWEIWEEKLTKPVLNLSSLQGISVPEKEENDSLVQTASTLSDHWNHTKKDLLSIGLAFETLDRTEIESHSHRTFVLMNETNFLQCAPQLVRLTSSMIVNTTIALLDILGKERGINLIRREPRLLTFRDYDIYYGIDFLSNMMGIPILFPSSLHPNRTNDKNTSTMHLSLNFQPFSPQILHVCYQKPDLLLVSIEGGIQERYVKRILGDAGNAITGANKMIVTDTATFLKNRRENK